MNIITLTTVGKIKDSIFFILVQNRDFDIVRKIVTALSNSDNNLGTVLSAAFLVLYLEAKMQGSSTT